MPIVSNYNRWTQDQLIERLAVVIDSIIDLERELAMLLWQETTKKLETWARSEQQSTTSRDRESAYEALTITTERIKVDGEIRALREERDLILFLCQRTPAT